LVENSFLFRRKQILAGKKRSALKKRESFSSDSTLLSTPSISRCSSVEDATLNELGRFDESYTYDKETDILSDSDATDKEVDTSTATTTAVASVATVRTLDLELDYIDVDNAGNYLETSAYHLTYNQAEFKHLSSSAASSKNKRAAQRRNRLEMILFFCRGFNFLFQNQCSMFLNILVSKFTLIKFEINVLTHECTYIL
jgi:hypothetical protein